MQQSGNHKPPHHKPLLLTSCTLHTLLFHALLITRIPSFRKGGDRSAIWSPYWLALAAPLITLLCVTLHFPHYLSPSHAGLLRATWDQVGAPQPLAPAAHLLHLTRPQSPPLLHSLKREGELCGLGVPCPAENQRGALAAGRPHPGQPQPPCNTREQEGTTPCGTGAEL